MNDQITQMLESYKDGVPVKIERASILLLSVAAILVVTISAMIVKLVKKL